jgi:uncharacterized protein YlxP (DUF503 family)
MSSKSRIEQILRYGLGEETTLPPNLSRVEILLVELIESGGGGGSINVDKSLSNVSTNPVQNKVIKEKFDILDGTGEGSIHQKITFAIAEIVADAPEDFDTLKEMSDWIDSHEESAAAMNSAIQQNTTAIAGKVDKVAGKGLSTNDYTTEEKTKLAGIETEANKTVVDSALDSSSINPVQNKVIKESLDGKVDKVSGKGLSTEDYTPAEKTKLAGLSNYDDTALTSRVSALETTVGDINSVLEEVL